MIVEAEVIIQESSRATWGVIADIENMPTVHSGVLQVEVLERPASGLVGLKWRETRLLFGKPASVIKLITEAVENEFYTARAEDGGFVFVTTKRLSESDGGTRLAESHESRPQGIIAWVMAIPMKLFFRGVIQKVLMQDLTEIKAAVEGKAAGHSGPPKD